MDYSKVWLLEKGNHHGVNLAIEMNENDTEKGIETEIEIENGSEKEKRDGQDNKRLAGHLVGRPRHRQMTPREFYQQILWRNSIS